MESKNLILICWVFLLGIASCTPEEDIIDDNPKPDLTSENAFYVAVNGDDDNAGNFDNPWKTVQHAANIMSAGDTVYIRQGTYNERVEPTYSGLTNKPIVYMAYPGETPIIDGTNVSFQDYYGIFTIDQKEHIILSGIHFQKSGNGMNNGGIIVDKSKNIVIKNCKTYNTKSSGIGIWESNEVIVKDNEIELACNGGEQECLTIANTTNFQVYGNTIHDGGPDLNGGEGLDIKDGSQEGLVYDNHVYNIKAVGIYIDAYDKETKNIEVYNNLVHDISLGAGGDQGIGLLIASEAGGLLKAIEVYNNVIYDCASFGIEFSNCCIGFHPLEDIYIINNTIYNNGYGLSYGCGIFVDNDQIQNIVIENNLISNNNAFELAVNFLDLSNLTIENNLIDGYGGEEGEVLGENSITEDPLFVDPTNRDLNVKASSPAIDNGSSSNAPSFDFNNNDRPSGNGFDIGAFEF